MMTPWGYDIDNLEPLLDVATFNLMTGGAHATNERTESALLAASQAIRNYCGWHICPSASCTAYPNGGGEIARLPAVYVSEVSEVVENGQELEYGTDYEWRRDGLLKRVSSPIWCPKWDSLRITYTAGFSIDAVSDLAEAVRTIAEGVLAVSAGVTSESADGVTIAYSASASSIAASLTTAQKAALAPYKVVSSHAA